MGRFGIKNGPSLGWLRGVDLLVGCTKSELACIDRMVTSTHVPSGKVLTEEGGVGLEFFVIVEGSASVWRNGGRLSLLEPGTFFGELGLLDGEFRTATVIAETPMHLLVLSQVEFRSLITLCPTVAMRIMTEMGARLRRAYDPVACGDLELSADRRVSRLASSPAAANQGGDPIASRISHEWLGCATRVTAYRSEWAIIK
jgi:CRP/FNR family cyclic AMP-dependent transcriptional regulator